MEQGIYMLAGIPVEIRSQYTRVQQMCRDYAAERSPMLTVETGREDISAERKHMAETYAMTGESADELSEPYLETLAVYRKIAERFLEYGVMLFHGSAVAVDGEAYLFIARSGTGKSTHTALWREQFGARAFMVNDDKPLLRIEDGGVSVCGTPWDGKHHLSRNTIVPLKAVCILMRGEQNAIEPVAPGDVFPALLQQCYFPDNAAAAGIRLLKTLTEHVPLYRLHCNMEREAALVAYNGMNAGN